MNSPIESWFRFPQARERSAQAEAERQSCLLRAAKDAAAAGSRRVWVSTPSELAAETDPLRLAVAIALHCETLHVVAAGLRASSANANSTSNSSWIRLAEDAATADGLCGGRLELAFEEVLEAALLERLRSAWSGAPVVSSARGDGAAMPIEIHPRPVRPDGPPLWAEAPNPSEAARAAEQGLGAVVADVASARAHVEAAGAGGFAPPPPVAIVRPGAQIPVEPAAERVAPPPTAISLARLDID